MDRHGIDKLGSITHDGSIVIAENARNSNVSTAARTRFPIILVLIAATSLGLVGGGSLLLWTRYTAVRAEATVRHCEPNPASRHRTLICRGTWVVGGSLLEGGRLVRGSGAT
jgi:hypothetical protein